MASPLSFKLPVEVVDMMVRKISKSYTDPEDLGSRIRTLNFKLGGLRVGRGWLVRLAAHPSSCEGQEEPYRRYSQAPARYVIYLCNKEGKAIASSHANSSCPWQPDPFFKILMVMVEEPAREPEKEFN